jgi:tocopherol cyclase
MRNIWNPGVFHGNRQDRQFFEGWYFKLISKDNQSRWAVIPGVFHHPDPELRHAFIQVLDGNTRQVIYHRFPVEDFLASKTGFEIRIGRNLFSGEGLVLDLDDDTQRITGEIQFGKLNPWPVKLFSPGVMGPFRFAPFMQTYHGVLSLDHSLDGILKIQQTQEDFTGWRGYIEKDWGQTFPRAYIWMQSNHFPEPRISFTASIATIPWLSGWFRGFLVGLLVEGRLFRFTTYLGSEVQSLTVNDTQVAWTVVGKSRSDPAGEFPAYELSILANRGQAGLLSSPEMDGMTPRILESLQASIGVKLSGLDKNGNPLKTIYQGKGSCGGLEVAGTISEIIDQD